MRKLLVLIAILSSFAGIAQDDTLSWKPETLNRYQVIQRKNGFSLGGYYRFYGFNRNLEEGYRVLPDNQFANTPPYVFGLGDVYRDPPILLMTAGIRPGGGAAINMDYALYSNAVGIPGQVPSNLNLGISLYGTVPTSFARLGFQIGGINWTDVSGMVFSSFVGYNRFSLFERWAWEGNAQGANRAQNYMQYGDISRESRWAMQAFKGVLFDLDELPYGINARFLYGKTPTTAVLGAESPNFTAGGRINKTFTKGMVGVNSMNYVVYLDSIASERGGISINTISASYENEKIAFNAEGGVGQLYSTVQNEGWGEGIRLNLRFKELIPKVPFEFEVFRLSPQFVNYYGNFLSFNTQILGDGQLQNVSGGGGASNFVGSITDVGQILNNRQGGSINMWFNLKNTTINFGNMVSQEMERTTNRLSFGHKINGLALSRFAPFATGIGPYRRWTSFYRGVAEDVFITDVDTAGLPFNKLAFNTFQFQLKHKFEFGKQDVYVLYLGSLGSVGDKISLIPKLNDQAYLRTGYHEFDIIVPINDWFGIDLAYGLERIQANDKTNNLYYFDADGSLAGANVSSEATSFADYGLEGTAIPGSSYFGATTGAPGYLDQTSHSIGFGADIKMSEHSGLYIRHKRFNQADSHFIEDKISGTETTIELKVFF